MPLIVPEKRILVVEKGARYEVLGLSHARKLIPLKSEMDMKVYDYDEGEIVTVKKGQIMKYVGTAEDVGAFPLLGAEQRSAVHVFLPLEDMQLEEGEYLVFGADHFSNFIYLGK